MCLSQYPIRAVTSTLIVAVGVVREIFLFVLQEKEFAMKLRTDLKSGSACYVVQSGDNLSKIAALYGTTVDAIWQSNRTTIGTNPNLIYPGQRLYIPD
jgi:nucleoid-associated protein YgaU